MPKKKPVPPSEIVKIKDSSDGSFLWNVSPMHPEDVVWWRGYAELMAQARRAYAEQMTIVEQANKEYTLRGLTSEKDGLFVMNKVAKAYPDVKWVLYQYRAVETVIMTTLKAGKIFRKSF